MHLPAAPRAGQHSVILLVGGQFQLQYNERSLISPPLATIWTPAVKLQGVRELV